jgi:hypothetical protein
MAVGTLLSLQYFGSGSESRRAKMTHKNRRKKNSMFRSAGCSPLRAKASPVA